MSEKRGSTIDTEKTNTVRLHRVLAAKPEKVYRAFLEADATAKWLPPNGFTCNVEQMEPKVGGKFRMSFKNFTTGKAIHSAENISSSFRMSSSATQTGSTIRICPASFM